VGKLEAVCPKWSGGGRGRIACSAVEGVSDNAPSEFTLPPLRARQLVRPAQILAQTCLIACRQSKKGGAVSPLQIAGKPMRFVPPSEPRSRGRLMAVFGMVRRTAVGRLLTGRSKGAPRP
jgi:hypothetical protein